MSEKGILYLSQDDVRKCLTIKDTLVSVEQGIKLLGEGKAIQPPKIYMELPKYHGFIKPMIAYVDDPVDISATKNFTFFPENRKLGKPTIGATIILNDPKTGAVLSIMDGTLITAWRTAATSAVAAKYLAKKSSETIGIIGAGVQGRSHLTAFNEVFDIKKVRVMDVSKEYREKYASEMSKNLGLDVKAVDTYKDAVEGADIVATVTTGKGEFVKKDWVKPGMTIIKAGSYQEIEFALLKQADKVLVDDWGYTSHRVPEITETGVDLKDIYAEVAQVVAGKKKGRQNDKEIIVFISIGMGVEDAVPALHAYNEAKKKGIGTWLKP